MLQGPFCHACGQSSESFERPIWSLLAEAMDNVLDADGRILRTLPRLALRPWDLTRRYLAGQRAAQTPPLRLFLVAIVLVFLVGDIGERRGGASWIRFNDQAEQKQRAAVDIQAKAASGSGARPKVDVDLEPEIVLGDRNNALSKTANQWFKPRFAYARAHPGDLIKAFKSWIHNLAIAFLPMATIILTLIFGLRRKVFIYDHAIFSMHSLAFMGFLLTAISLLSLIPVAGPYFGWLALAAPVHLYKHMRGVYQTSRWGTILRMALLAILSLFAMSILILVAAALGLNDLNAAP
jgi:hypothetical protein